MLVAEKLVKTLGGRRIIEEVSLTLRRGEIVGILGPNGAGKTTSFRMLTGMIAPDAGRITLDDLDITEMPFYQRARHGISYLPQDSFLPRSITVEHSIEMVLEVREASQEKRRGIMRELIAEFHLEAVRKTRIGTLSGGQRRRCEIAVTLASNPSFALLDEPFAGVDPNTVTDIAAEIRQLAGRGIGVLITDHNARVLFDLVDRAYVIERGRVLAHGSSEDVIANEAVRSVYLGESFQI